jgi:predicted nucleic acid-binding protein
MKTYTLDTSALMAYFFDEAGADEVERLLRDGEKKRATLYASFMTYMEVLYRIWQRLGEKEGKAYYLRLKALPIRPVAQTEELLLESARFKVQYDVSMADAWIAATALHTRSILVHKDPEFDSLSGLIQLRPLPYKKNPV